MSSGLSSTLGVSSSSLIASAAGSCDISVTDWPIGRNATASKPKETEPSSMNSDAIAAARATADGRVRRKPGSSSEIGLATGKRDMDWLLTEK
jgi:hypothetical protein